MSDINQPPEGELCAIFRATPEAMADLLQLPKGAYVDAVTASLDEPGVVKFRIRGAGFRVRIGSLIPDVRPIVSMKFDASGKRTDYTINWDFPVSQ